MILVFQLVSHSEHFVFRRMYIFPDYTFYTHGMYLRCVARKYFMASIDLSDWTKEINRVHCSVNDIDRPCLIPFE